MKGGSSGICGSAATDVVDRSCWSQRYSR